MPEPAGKPIGAKLGLAPGSRLALVRPPAGFERRLRSELGGLNLFSLRARNLDVVHIFCRDRTDLADGLPKAQRAIKAEGAVWISWPKKGSPLHAGLDEGQVRALGLAAGLVDVKVAAIDQDWSGLKFVYRLRDRPRAP